MDVNHVVHIQTDLLKSKLGHFFDCVRETEHSQGGTFNLEFTVCQIRCASIDMIWNNVL